MIIHFQDRYGSEIAPSFSNYMESSVQWPRSENHYSGYGPYGRFYAVCMPHVASVRVDWEISVSLADGVTLVDRMRRSNVYTAQADGSARITSQGQYLSQGSETPWTVAEFRYDESRGYAQEGDQYQEFEHILVFDGVPPQDGGTDGTAPRHDRPADAPFAFFRIRGLVSTQFFPGDGARLSFASLAADTLDLPFAAHGFLAPGDLVSVTFFGDRVFLGSIDTIRHHRGGGEEEHDAVTASGPWAKLSRLVYLQTVATGVGLSQKTSRLVLNQAADGSEQTADQALAAVLAFAAPKCGFAAGSVAVSSTLHLPFDQCRDITCADALRRLLRFFPRVVSRFDYSAAAPSLSLSRPDTSLDVGDYSRLLSLDTTRNAHPVARVDLEIESVGSDGYRSISHRRYPDVSATDYDDTEVNTLYATLQVAAAESSTVTQSFTAKGESVGDFSSAQWWIDRHPRLKGIPQSAVSISDAARSDASEAAQYPYISRNSAPDITSANLKCHVARFSCKASIQQAADVERDILLTVDYLVTNAVPDRKYTWVTASSSTSGEAVPSWTLAQAIYEDNAGSLTAQDASIALPHLSSDPHRFPQIGDVHDGLVLQSFQIECSSLVASLHFGAPSHLSPDDMASLLSGFRNRRRCTTATSRVTGKPEDNASGAEVETGVTPPLSSSEWQPGSKSKMTLSPSSGSSSVVIDASSTSGGSISLSTASVPAGQTIAPHTLTIGSGSSAISLTVLATADASITGGSGGSGGVSPAPLNGLVAVTTIEPPSSSNGYNITAKRKRITASASSISVSDTTDVQIPTTPLSAS